VQLGLPFAVRTQALRNTKTMRATTRMSPSMPPPMYMLISKLFVGADIGTLRGSSGQDATEHRCLPKTKFFNTQGASCTGVLAHRPFQKQFGSLWLQFSVSRLRCGAMSRDLAPCSALEPEEERCEVLIPAPARQGRGRHEPESDLQINKVLSAVHAPINSCERGCRRFWTAPNGRG
jgi:hypothetical protein